MNGLNYRLSRLAFIFIGSLYKSYNVTVREKIINYCDFFIPDDLVYVYFEYILPIEKSNTIRLLILNNILYLQQHNSEDMVVMSKYIFDHLKVVADTDKSPTIREKCLEYVVHSSRCERENIISLLLSRIQDIDEKIQVKALNMFLSYHIQDDIEIIGTENMLKIMKMVNYIMKNASNYEVSHLCNLIIYKDCYNHRNKYNYGNEKDNIAVRCIYYCYYYIY